MPAQTWEVLLNAYEFSGSEKGAVVENTVTETALSPGAVTPGQNFIIPASYLKIGTVIRITATGIVSTKALATALTLGIRVAKPGEAATAGPFWTKILMKSSTTAKKSATWSWETTTRIVSVGTTAKAVTQGKFHGYVGVSNSETEGIGCTMIPTVESTTGGESESFESGVERQIVLTAKWGEASTEDKITCYQWLIEALN